MPFQRHREGRRLDAQFWGARQLLCVPCQEPGLAKPSRLCLELLSHSLAWISTLCAKSQLLPNHGLEHHKSHRDKAHRNGEGQGDLTVLLSIDLSRCLDITKQQTDFPLPLIKPDPRPCKFNQNGNSRPLSETSKRFNSYQLHGVFFLE